MRKGVLMAVLVAITACGGDGGTGPEPTPVPGDATVSMPGLTFSPFTTNIRVAQSVIFDFPALPHNVIFANRTGAPANILTTSNRPVSRTFASVGTFPYDCTLHPGMAGTVIVAP